MLWSIQPLTTFKSTIGLIGSLFALRCEGAGGASEFISDWQTVAHFFVQFLTISHHSLSFKVFSQKTHECIFLAFVLIWIQHNWSLGRHLRLHCLSSSIGNSTASLSLSLPASFLLITNKDSLPSGIFYDRENQDEKINAEVIGRTKLLKISMQGKSTDERIYMVWSKMKESLYFYPQLRVWFNAHVFTSVSY